MAGYSANALFYSRERSRVRILPGPQLQLPRLEVGRIRSTCVANAHHFSIINGFELSD